MGTIRRQSIISSLFIYLGFAIGALNQLILFQNNKFFSTEQFGLTRVLNEVAVLFAGAFTLGSLNISWKFFPFYKSYLPPKKNDLPFICLSLLIIGSILFLTIIPAIEPFLLNKFGARSPLFVQYFYLIYPFTITLAFFNLMEAFAWTLQRAVLSNFMKEFFPRIATTVLIIAFMLGWIRDFRTFAILYSLIYGPPAIILLIAFLMRKEFPVQPRISSVTRRLSKRMFVFGSTFFITAMLNIIARTNDTIIIVSQSVGGLRDAAVFVVATYFVTMIEVPQRSVISASVAQISTAWKEKDLAKIDRLYKKSALNLLIAGMFIFGLLLVNAELLAAILGPVYAPIPFIILLLGAAKLIDMGTGLNSTILVLSKHWWIDILSSAVFVVLAIVLNYFLTKRYGVYGPAYGGIISMVVFNLIRFLFIWKLFRLQPFNRANLLVLLLGAACVGISWFISIGPNPYLNILLRSAIFVGLYTAAVVGFRLSNETTELFQMGVDQVRKRFRQAFGRD